MDGPGVSEWGVCIVPELRYVVFAVRDPEYGVFTVVILGLGVVMIAMVLG